MIKKDNNRVTIMDIDKQQKLQVFTPAEWNELGREMQTGVDSYSLPLNEALIASVANDARRARESLLAIDETEYPAGGLHSQFVFEKMRRLSVLNNILRTLQPYLPPEQEPTVGDEAEAFLRDQES